MEYSYETNEDQVKELSNDPNFLVLSRIYYHANKFNIPKKYISKVALCIEEKLDNDQLDMIAWTFANKFNSVIKCLTNEFGEDAESFIMGNNRTSGVDVYADLNISNDDIKVHYWFTLGFGDCTVKLKEYKGITK